MRATVLKRRADGKAGPSSPRRPRPLAIGEGKGAGDDQRDAAQLQRHRSRAMFGWN
jgi:hypothetical protein